MTVTKGQRVILPTAIVLGLLTIVLPARIDAIDLLAEEWGKTWGERIDGGYYSLVDAGNRFLTYSARILDPGDIYITADNRQYRVKGVEEDTIHMELMRRISLPDVAVDAVEPGIAARMHNWVGNVTGGLFAGLFGRRSEVKGPVAIYHSHSDESYRPSSGKASEKTGDVYQVGQVMVKALRDLGYEAVQSGNNHNPHDGGAYVRSRRTVEELMEKRPVTMLDIHRDAVPAGIYRTEVNGEPVTKVRLVVGRQNQNRQANLEYAKRIKAVADKKLPGIIQDIFFAKGNYNQDIGPRMMLLEFGSHENTLERAEAAARLFARVIPAAAGLTGETAEEESARTGSIAGRIAVWIVVIAVTALVAFLVMNVKSWDQFKARLARIVTREFRDTVDIENDHDEDDTPGR